MTSSPVRVGIIGLGRSGWSIHALGLKHLPEQYRIVAVADLIAERRVEAQQTFGCRAYAGYGELLADREVELVIVAPPSYLHAVYTIAALQAGKAVVCEKPMAENLADADSMLAAAQRTGSLLTMFQNRRYEASYLKVREVIASGVLGRIFQIKLTVHSFGRRWDWQTLRAFAGGQLRNNGVHFIDQSLQLMDLGANAAPIEPDVFYRETNALALGDAEDSFKLLLTAPGAPLVDLELVSACAYAQEPWLVMGALGTLAGSFDALRWKYVRPEELSPHQLDTQSTPDRSYNRDDLRFHEESWSAPKPDDETSASFISMTLAYYRDLYRTLREGAPLAVPPEGVRRVMRVVELCKEQTAGSTS
jgi:predicted dehydrogenase